ncbi:hypothetical protein B0T25DRAFT_547592 [Lasiosphaeria hispida]|uniref:Uncharacterized protein n=1 Tax=Lasiosphaeria hispida TaxID=260671 RepID=A0AAJ0HEB7_9PEZI|nr:hypothetical protein B0T25DRAFT_547592 [Lasiosphaeria hispida]
MPSVAIMGFLFFASSISRFFLFIKGRYTFEGLQPWRPRRWTTCLTPPLAHGPVTTIVTIPGLVILRISNNRPPLRYTTPCPRPSFGHQLSPGPAPDKSRSSPPTPPATATSMSPPFPTRRS